MEKGKIFFSYSRNDASAFALKLAADLRRAGLNIWMDQLDIHPSQKWDMEIQKALTASEFILFIVSENSVISDNVLDEVNHGLNNKKKVIPIIIGKCEIPYRVSRFQYVDFMHDYENGLSTLLRDLDPENTNALIIPEEKHRSSFFRLHKKLLYFGGAALVIILGLFFLLTRNNNSKMIQAPTDVYRKGSSIRLDTQKRTNIKQLPASAVKEYTGKMGNLPATFQLAWKPDGQFDGSYEYTNHKTTDKYTLKGKKLSESTIELTEYINGAESGSASLQLTGNCYHGTMTSIKDGHISEMTICSN